MLDTKTVNQAYKSSHSKIKDFIDSDEYGELLKSLQSELSLRIDQVGSIATCTTYVLLGLTPRAKYIENLQKEAGLTKEDAQSVADKVNQKVFERIREHLGEPGTADEESENSVLEQIERPAPTGSRIGPSHAPAPTTPEHKPPSNLPTDKSAPIEASEKDDAGQSIMESRLKEPMVNAFQKTEVGEKVKRSYPDGSDPYKEPVE